jgi:methionyl aminopeptidase
VNRVVVHGIPSEKDRLREGDIVGIDFACFKDGYCADAARTLAVGVISAPARALLDTTRECLERGIAQCELGNRMGDVGAAIEAHALSRGFDVVRDFVGHGIGTAMHEPPEVPNHGSAASGIRLSPGMVIAIEPMLTAGKAELSVRDDGWTVETRDRSLAAHFEHTVAITRDGMRVLTA